MNVLPEDQAEGQKLSKNQILAGEVMGTLSSEIDIAEQIEALPAKVRKRVETFLKPRKGFEHEDARMTINSWRGKLTSGMVKDPQTLLANLLDAIDIEKSKGRSADCAKLMEAMILVDEAYASEFVRVYAALLKMGKKFPLDPLDDIFGPYIGLAGGGENDVTDINAVTLALGEILDSRPEALHKIKGYEEGLLPLMAGQLQEAAPQPAKTAVMEEKAKQKGRKRTLFSGFRRKGKTETEEKKV